MCQFCRRRFLLHRLLNRARNKRQCWMNGWMDGDASSRVHINECNLTVFFCSFHHPIGPCWNSSILWTGCALVWVPFVRPFPLFARTKGPLSCLGNFDFVVSLLGFVVHLLFVVSMHWMRPSLVNGLEISSPWTTVCSIYSWPTSSTSHSLKTNIIIRHYNHQWQSQRDPRESVHACCCLGCDHFIHWMRPGLITVALALGPMHGGHDDAFALSSTPPVYLVCIVHY